MGGTKNNTNVKEFCIPDYIFKPGSMVRNASHSPTCPVLVFINSKSGGQLGSELLKTYYDVLNKNQVFDLSQNAPEKVLREFYLNIENLKHAGDGLAFEIQKKLRMIVAGGDGTASWLLGILSDLSLPYSPPIATVPLGTGNNLPFLFGWGKKNPGTDHRSVLMFLDKVRAAKEMKIDSWHFVLRMKASKESPRDPLVLLELPHSLHACDHVPTEDKLNTEGLHTYLGGFWNYFSMGMDAQVSYAFHSERKLHPERFKNQSSNQVAYAKYVCKQGWFCACVGHPSSRNIAKLMKVKIMKRHGQWEDLCVPPSVRSIVCLNLPSFSGGLNPWGTPNRRKSLTRDLTPPFVDDGLLEIVGFKDAWHGLVLFTPNGHGTRLAQARRIRFEFSKGGVGHVFMRLDGEPWQQPLPMEDDAIVLEISHFGQVGMLATPGSRSRSTREASSPTSTRAMEAGTWPDEGCSIAGLT